MKLSLRKMNAFDVGLNYLNGPPEELFRIASSKIIDLSDFRTIVRKKGMNIDIHIMHNEFDRPYKELFNFLQTRTNYIDDYENLD